MTQLEKDLTLAFRKLFEACERNGVFGRGLVQDKVAYEAVLAHAESAPITHEGTFFLQTKPNGERVVGSNDAIRALTEAFAEKMKLEGCKDVVMFDTYANGIKEKLSVTIQRVSGRTPTQLYAETARELHDLRVIHKLLQKGYNGLGMVLHANHIALREMVALADLHDAQQGETPEFEARRSLAWDQARKLVENYAPTQEGHVAEGEGSRLETAGVGSNNRVAYVPTL